MKPSARNCITKGLSAGERYAQLAEECNELGKAALKIRRIITPGASPTLITIEEALDNLNEELANVLVCCDVLPLDWAKVHDIERKKSERWVKRLMEREGEMRKVVRFSENQIVYSSQDDERYRVPIGDKYEVSIISTAYSYGGSLGLYEIALMKDGKLVKLRGKVEGFQDDDVLGYLTEDDVRKYIEILREFVRTGRRSE